MRSLRTFILCNCTVVNADSFYTGIKDVEGAHDELAACSLEMELQGQEMEYLVWQVQVQGRVFQGSSCQNVD